MTRRPSRRLARRLTQRLNLVLGLVALLAVLGVVAFAAHQSAGSGDSAPQLLGRTFTDFGAPDPQGLSAEQRAVSAAARAEVLAFLSVDYRDMEPKLQAVIDGATGDFKQQYVKAKADLIKAATLNKSISVGSVQAVGVGAMDADSATAYVAANSAVQNVNTGGSSQPRYYRIKVDLELVGGQWLASSVGFVD